MSGLFMDSSVSVAVHYCCVFNGEKKLHTYNGGDGELESLAELCLGKAPSYHAWYFHTMGRRTYGFFMEDGKTYFTIAESSLGNPAILQFLRHVRDGFKKSQKSGVQEELIPIIQRLVASLGNVARPTFTERTPERPTSTKAPLLGKATSKHDRKKMKDRATDAMDIGENHTDRGVIVDMPSDSMSGISVPKNLSRSRSQQVARRLWCRHVRIIIAVDIILCLILFGIWLAVCNGFQCISQSHG